MASIDPNGAAINTQREMQRDYLRASLVALICTIVACILCFVLKDDVLKKVAIGATVVGAGATLWSLKKAYECYWKAVGLQYAPPKPAVVKNEAPTYISDTWSQDIPTDLKYMILNNLGNIVDIYVQAKYWNLSGERLWKEYARVLETDPKDAQLFFEEYIPYMLGLGNYEQRNVESFLKREVSCKKLRDVALVPAPTSHQKGTVGLFEFYLRNGRIEHLFIPFLETAPLEYISLFLKYLKDPQSHEGYASNFVGYAPALFWALRRKDETIIQALICSQETLSPCCYHYFPDVVANCSIETVQMMLERGMKPSPSFLINWQRGKDGDKNRRLVLLLLDHMTPPIPHEKGQLIRRYTWSQNEMKKLISRCWKNAQSLIDSLERNPFWTTQLESMDIRAYAVAECSLDFVKELVAEDNTRITHPTAPMLFIAAKRQDPLLVTYLLDNPHLVDISMTGRQKDLILEEVEKMKDQTLLERVKELGPQPAPAKSFLNE